MNGCEHPIDEKSGQDNTVLQAHGNVLDRTTRQTVLTLKNNILRDNVGVMAYSGIRYAVDAKKHKESAPTRKMDIEGERYTIDSTFRQRESYTTLSRRSSSTGSAQADDKTRIWTPPSVELGVRGGFHGYYGGNGGAGGNGGKAGIGGDGGMGGTGRGGAIYVVGGSLLFVNGTVAGNTVQAGAFGAGGGALVAEHGPLGQGTAPYHRQRRAGFDLGHLQQRSREC